MGSGVKVDFSLEFEKALGQIRDLQGHLKTLGTNIEKDFDFSKASEKEKQAIQEVVRELNVLQKETVQTGKAGVNSFNQQTQGLDNLKHGVKSLIGAYAGFAVVRSAFHTITSTIQDSLKVFREFELRLKEVGTLLSKEQSVEFLPQYKEELKRISELTGKSLGDLTKATYNALSSGAVDAAGAMKFVESSAKGAVAGLADTSDTINLLTNIMNSYNLSTKDTDMILNSLQSTVRVAKADLKTLSADFAKGVPLAKNLGIGLVDLEASYAKLTLQTGQSAESITQLNSLWTTLKEPDALNKFVELLGPGFAKVFDMEKRQVKDFNGMIELMQKAVETGGPQVKNALMDILPRKEAQLALNALLDSEKVENSVRSLSEAIQKGIAGKEMEYAFGEISTANQFTIDQATAAWTNAKTELGEVMAPTFGQIALQLKDQIPFIKETLIGLAPTIQSGFAVFTSLLPNIEVFISSIIKMVSVLGTILGVISPILGPMSGFIGLLGTAALIGGKVYSSFNMLSGGISTAMSLFPKLAGGFKVAIFGMSATLSASGIGLLIVGIGLAVAGLIALFSSLGSSSIEAAKDSSELAVEFQKKTEDIKKEKETVASLGNEYIKLKEKILELEGQGKSAIGEKSKLNEVLMKLSETAPLLANEFVKLGNDITGLKEASKKANDEMSKLEFDTNKVSGEVALDAFKKSMYAKAEIEANMQAAREAGDKEEVASQNKKYLEILGLEKKNFEIIKKTNDPKLLGEVSKSFDELHEKRVKDQKYWEGLGRIGLAQENQKDYYDSLGKSLDLNKERYKNTQGEMDKALENTKKKQGDAQQNSINLEKSLNAEVNAGTLNREQAIEKIQKQIDILKNMNEADLIANGYKRDAIPLLEEQITKQKDLAILDEGKKLVLAELATLQKEVNDDLGNQWVSENEITKEMVKRLELKKQSLTGKIEDVGFQIAEAKTPEQKEVLVKQKVSLESQIPELDLQIEKIKEKVVLVERIKINEEEVLNRYKEQSIGIAGVTLKQEELIEKEIIALELKKEKGGLNDEESHKLEELKNKQIEVNTESQNQRQLVKETFGSYEQGLIDINQFYLKNTEELDGQIAKLESQLEVDGKLTEMDTERLRILKEQKGTIEKTTEDLKEQLLNGEKALSIEKIKALTDKSIKEAGVASLETEEEKKQKQETSLEIGKQNLLIQKRKVQSEIQEIQKSKELSHSQKNGLEEQFKKAKSIEEQLGKIRKAEFIKTKDRTEKENKKIEVDKKKAHDEALKRAKQLTDVQEKENKKLAAEEKKRLAKIKAEQKKAEAERKKREKEEIDRKVKQIEEGEKRALELIDKKLDKDLKQIKFDEDQLKIQVETELKTNFGKVVFSTFENIGNILAQDDLNEDQKTQAIINAQDKLVKEYEKVGDEITKNFVNVAGEIENLFKETDPRLKLFEDILKKIADVNKMSVDTSDDYLKAIGLGMKSVALSVIKEVTIEASKINKLSEQKKSKEEVLKTAGRLKEGETEAKYVDTFAIQDEIKKIKEEIDILEPKLLDKKNIQALMEDIRGRLQEYFKSEIEIQTDFINAVIKEEENNRNLEKSTKEGLKGYKRKFTKVITENIGGLDDERIIPDLVKINETINILFGKSSDKEKERIITEIVNFFKSTDANLGFAKTFREYLSKYFKDFGNLETLDPKKLVNAFSKEKSVFNIAEIDELIAKLEESKDTVNATFLKKVKNDIEKVKKDQIGTIQQQVKSKVLADRAYLKIQKNINETTQLEIDKIQKDQLNSLEIYNKAFEGYFSDQEKELNARIEKINSIIQGKKVFSGEDVKLIKEITTKEGDISGKFGRGKEGIEKEKQYQEFQRKVEEGSETSKEEIQAFLELSKKSGDLTSEQEEFVQLLVKLTQLTNEQGKELIKLENKRHEQEKKNRIEELKMKSKEADLRAEAFLREQDVTFLDVFSNSFKEFDKKMIGLQGEELKLRNDLLKILERQDEQFRIQNENESKLAERKEENSKATEELNKRLEELKKKLGSFDEVGLNKEKKSLQDKISKDQADLDKLKSTKETSLQTGGYDEQRKNIDAEIENLKTTLGVKLVEAVVETEEDRIKKLKDNIIENRKNIIGEFVDFLTEEERKTWQSLSDKELVDTAKKKAYNLKDVRQNIKGEESTINQNDVSTLAYAITKLNEEINKYVKPQKDTEIEKKNAEIERENALINANILAKELEKQKLKDQEKTEKEAPNEIKAKELNVTNSTARILEIDKALIEKSSVTEETKKEKEGIEEQLKEKEKEKEKILDEEKAFQKQIESLGEDGLALKKKEIDERLDYLNTKDKLTELEIQQRLYELNIKEKLTDDEIKEREKLIDLQNEEYEGLSEFEIKEREKLTSQSIAIDKRNADKNRKIAEEKTKEFIKIVDEIKKTIQNFRGIDKEYRQKIEDRETGVGKAAGILETEGIKQIGNAVGTAVGIPMLGDAISAGAGLVSEIVETVADIFPELKDEESKIQKAHDEKTKNLEYQNVLYKIQLEYLDDALKYNLQSVKTIEDQNDFIEKTFAAYRAQNSFVNQYSTLSNEELINQKLIEKNRAERIKKEKEDLEERIKNRNIFESVGALFNDPESDRLKELNRLGEETELSIAALEAVLTYNTSIENSQKKQLEFSHKLLTLGEGFTKITKKYIESTIEYYKNITTLTDDKKNVIVSKFKQLLDSSNLDSKEFTRQIMQQQVDFIKSADFSKLTVEDQMNEFKNLNDLQKTYISSWIDFFTKEFEFNIVFNETDINTDDIIKGLNDQLSTINQFLFSWNKAIDDAVEYDVNKFQTNIDGILYTGQEGIDKYVESMGLSIDKLETQKESLQDKIQRLNQMNILGFDKETTYGKLNALEYELVLQNRILDFMIEEGKIGEDLYEVRTKIYNLEKEIGQTLIESQIKIFEYGKSIAQHDMENYEEKLQLINDEITLYENILQQKKDDGKTREQLWDDEQKLYDLKEDRNKFLMNSRIEAFEHEVAMGKYDEETLEGRNKKIDDAIKLWENELQIAKDNGDTKEELWDIEEKLYDLQKEKLALLKEENNVIKDIKAKETKRQLDWIKHAEETGRITKEYSAIAQLKLYEVLIKRLREVGEISASIEIEKEMADTIKNYYGEEIFKKLAGTGEVIDFQNIVTALQGILGVNFKIGEIIKPPEGFIPQAETGGDIKKEGLAYLHPAEIVLNPERVKVLDDLSNMFNMAGGMSYPNFMMPENDNKNIEDNRSYIININSDIKNGKKLGQDILSEIRKVERQTTKSII